MSESYRGLRRILRHLLVAAASLTALGCGENVLPALSSAPTVEWTATEDLRIGSVDDSASALTRIGSLAIDSAGRIYVTQPVDKTIRVFNAAGHRVGAFGRPGDGPGEFRAVSNIGILKDTLYVPDMVAQRVTFFSLAGRLLGTLSVVPRGLGKEWLPIVPLYLGADGTALARPGFLAIINHPNTDHRDLLLRIDRSGEILDTAALVVTPPQRWITLRGPFGPVVMPQLFRVPFFARVSADGSRVALVGDGGAVGRTATFQVTELRSIRDTVWSHSYAYEPLPLSAVAVDSVVAEAGARLNPEAFPDRADAERQIRKGISPPDHLSPVSGFVFADDGDLWLRREDVLGRDQRWTVLDAAGSAVAWITLPRGLNVKAIRSNRLWGVETDALGVPYVVRYVITR